MFFGVILTNVRIHEHGCGRFSQSVFMDPDPRLSPGQASPG